MAVNNSLTAKRNNTGLSAYLTQDAVKAKINDVIGGENGQRFISSIVSAVSANPQLAECSNPSILSAALLGESLKLSPSPQLGHFYLVPYNEKGKGKVAQFQLGYKGYIQLAIRSGQYKKLNVLAIKEGELVRFDPLNEEIEVNLIEDEAVRESAPTVGYYAMFEYTNGFKKAIYWSKAKMEAHAEKYSAGYRAHKGYTFWEKDFDAMAYKTMLRQLISKWGVMSIEFQNAMESDMAVINEDGSRNYVDNTPDIIETQAEEIDPNETTHVTEEIINRAEAKEEAEKAEANDAAAALFG